MYTLSHFLYTVLPNVPTSKKHRGNRLGEMFFIGMFGNGLPLAVSGGFGTKNCQTKIKVKWKTKN